MKSKILVDYEAFMCSVALIEDGVLREFYIEDKNIERITGDIFKGRVVNVLPGLESAFVDIGRRRNGFLAASDMLENRTVISRSGQLPTQLNVSEGEYVLVQAIKEQTDTKGARLSANLSIPGRYIVYMPTVDFIGVSNKITDQATRERLLELLTRNRPHEGCGLIARTAAKDASKADIIEEIEYFERLHERILEKFNAAQGVEMLYSDGDLIFRTVRDLLNSTVEEIVCNNRAIADRLEADLARNLAQPVRVTVPSEDILKKYGVLSEVERLLRSKVELKSGGTLVIDRTEALTVIDVNTAKYIGDTDRERTVFEINCEAAREIARQIRLRNVGGMIVIDFIDMTDPMHNEEVVDVLRRAAASDRMRTRVLPMTELGLVQMTRKKSGSELQSLLTEQCEECHGKGRALSANFLMRKIKAALTDVFVDGSCTAAVVAVDPQMYDKLAVADWQLSFGRFVEKTVYVVADPDLSKGAYRITAKTGAIISVPDRAYLLT